MNTKKKIIENSITYILPQALKALLPLASLPIISRILSKEDFGVLALANIYAILLADFASLGLNLGYNRNFFQYREDSKKSAELLYSVLLLVMSNLILLSILTYIFRSQLSVLFTGLPEYGNLIFYSFCASGMVSIKLYFLNYYRNIEDARSYVKYMLSFDVVNFTLSIFMVVYLRSGVLGLVYSQLIASSIVTLILYYKFTLLIKPLSFNRKLLLEVLKISYPLTPRIFLGAVNNHFDKYMIAMLSTVGGVGIYSIGQRISAFVFSIMASLQNVMSPHVYKIMFSDDKEGQYTIGRYLTPFAYSFVLIGLAVSLFSEEIIFILTPPSYYAAANIISILAMYYTLLFFGMQQQLIYKKKTHISTILSAITLVLVIVLNMIFIKRWGTIGAAWATLIVGLVSGTISFVISQYYYEIKWEYRKVGLIYLIFFVSSILMILLRNSDVTYVIRLTSKCISISFYIYLGIKLKVITMENYVLIKNMIPLRRIAFSDRS